VANEDRDYLRWIAAHPCAMCGAASGPPHHPRHDVGLGLRAHDHRAVPLCHSCHEELHRLNGHFAGWSRDKLRSWLDAVAASMRVLHDSSTNGVKLCEF
jgi:hypothetical protein